MCYFCLYQWRWLSASGEQVLILSVHAYTIPTVIGDKRFITVQHKDNILSLKISTVNALWGITHCFNLLHFRNEYYPSIPKILSGNLLFLSHFHCRFISFCFTLLWKQKNHFTSQFNKICSIYINKWHFFIFEKQMGLTGMQLFYA